MGRLTVEVEQSVKRYYEIRGGHLIVITPTGIRQEILVVGWRSIAKDVDYVPPALQWSP